MSLLDLEAPAVAATQLAASLKDEDPRVRAVAARLANVLDQRTLADEVGATLAVETDLDAARELMRALAALGGNDVSPALLAAAARLGDPMLEEALIALARARGKEALELYFSKDISDSAVREPEFFRLAIRGDRKRMMDFAARTLENRMAFFPTVMAMADEASIPIPESLLAKALAHEERSIREIAVIWMIQWSWDQSYVDPPALLEALEAGERKDKGEDKGSAHDLWRELLARILGRAPREAPARIERLKAMNGLTWILAWRLTIHMTPAEQQVAGDRFKPGPVFLALWPPNASRSRYGSGDYHCLELPRGFPEVILIQSGCKPQPHSWTAQAVVTYDEGGRPQQVRIVRIDMYEPVPHAACANAITRLLRASLATDGYLTGRYRNRELLLSFSFPEGWNSRLEERSLTLRSTFQASPCSEDEDPGSPRRELERLARFR